MNESPTAELLGNLFYRSNIERFALIAPNVFLEWGCGEMDLLCLRKSGFIEEVEIKISVADYHADFKKTVKREAQGPSMYPSRYIPWGNHPKHAAIKDGEHTANRFNFLMPIEIAEKVTIPDYAGLFVFDNGRVSHRKTAPLLHRRKISDEKQIELGRKMCYRYWSVRRSEDKAQ